MQVEPGQRWLVTQYNKDVMAIYVIKSISRDGKTVNALRHKVCYRNQYGCRIELNNYLTKHFSSDSDNIKWRNVDELCAYYQALVEIGEIPKGEKLNGHPK